MKHFYRMLAVSLSVLIFISTIAGILFANTIKSEISYQFQIYGMIVVFFFSFLTEFLPEYLSPHILLVGGLIPGVDRFFLLSVVLIGSILGSFIGFQLGRKIGENVMEDVFGKELYVKVRRSMNQGGRWYVAIAAVSPLPYVPMIMGSLKLSYRNFIIYGVIPRSIGFILVTLLINKIF